MSVAFVAVLREPVAPAAGLGDQGCMLFSGTIVATGQARGVVVETGARTQIGRISGMPVWLLSKAIV